MSNYGEVICELHGIYKGIEEYCKNCNLCCFTYGWITKSEEEFYENFCDLVEINNKVSCFDSFKRDLDGNRIVDVIPRCLFYKQNKCSINLKKPFDCFLYPVKILYSKADNSFLVVLSLDCPYVQSLSEIELENLKNKVNILFTKMSKELLVEYLEIVKSWTSLSKPKDFSYMPLKIIKGSVLDS